MTGDAYDDGGGLDPAHKQPLPPEAPPVKQPLPPETPRTEQPLPPGAPPVKQPLPPEISPGGHPLPPDAPPMPSEAPRIKQPLPPEAPPAGPSGPEGPGDDGAPGEWWRTADIRGELRDTWAEQGREGWQAAQEIGAAVGEAVAAHLPHLPDPYAAAQRRGLDLRWLRLGVNVPALLVSLLVTWGGQSPEGRMAAGIRTGGLFAPLGWVLLPALVLAVLMVLPFGGVLGAAAGALVSAAARGLVALFRRAWAVPYAGYLLRLATAVAGWSFLLAAAHSIGRVAINVLTGV